MPTILTPDLAERWIFDDLTPQQITEIASFQIPSEEMLAYTIPKDYLTSKVLEKYTYEECPELEAEGGQQAAVTGGRKASNAPPTLFDF
jgi:hypothetical protein